MKYLTDIYNPTPKSSVLSSRGLKQDSKTVNSCDSNGQITLGTLIVVSSCTIDGPLQSIPNSKDSS